MMRFNLILWAFLLCTLSITAQAKVSTVSIPVTAIDGSLSVNDWHAIRRYQHLPLDFVVGSEALNPEWSGNVVVLLRDQTCVPLPLSSGGVGRHRLRIGLAAGNGLGGFDIVLNGTVLGHCDAAGSATLPVMFVVQTPSIWAHGNKLELVSDQPRSIGVLYVACEPLDFVPVPQAIWQVNAQQPTQQVTYFHNPLPFCQPVWTLSSNEPCSLWINGTMFLQTEGGMVMGKVPFGLNDRVSEIILKPTTQTDKPMQVILKTTPLGGARFFKEVPSSLRAGAHVDDWPHVTLSNGHISAVIAMPDNVKGFYRGPRFEQAGMVTSLQYAGHEFISQNQPQKRNPTANDHVAGPAGEFAEPVGYDEAAVGEGFVKIGVGLLEKPNAPAYFFGALYRQLEPFAWQSTVTGNQAAFHQQVKTTSGYGYDYTKTVTLPTRQSRMEIEHTLRNTGSKRIDTTHYAHNFFLVDRMPPSSDYTLTYGFTPRFNRPFKPDALMKLSGERFNLVSPKTWFSEVSGCTEASSNWCELQHQPSGTALRITESNAPITQALYLCPDGICSESFVHIALEPGMQTTWSRVYDLHRTDAEK